MKQILLEEKYIIEYIFDILNNNLKDKINIDAKYHHNSSYNDSISILNYGILSLKDMNSKNIKVLANNELDIMGNIESHVNGSDGISLAVVGLKDIYPNEFEYDPFVETKVDFLIDSNIKASRLSTHYGNEFISYEPISCDKIRSLDIRMLKLINSYLKKNKYLKIEDIINNYNLLIEMSNLIIKKHLDIPLCECSFEKKELDVNNISKQPILKLRKN